MATPASASLLYACGCSSPIFTLRVFRSPPPSSSSPSSSSLSLSSRSCSSSEFGRPGANHLLKKNNFELQAMSSIVGNLSPKGIVEGEMAPDHLLVLVHGILASPSDWTYFEAELKRRLGRNFLIYASSSNTYTKTLSGVDGAGRRLAEEVKEVVQKTESLKKISFLAHSLGGLFARYALAVLYARKVVGDDELVETSKTDHQPEQDTIAGLKPISFITLATPHLGVRGRKQLPFLFGVPFLEKLAIPIAPILVGRTGKQLFLTDGKSNRPPLLLRMTSDCADGKFISALGSFRCRILYANTSFDHMVGWRTSSVRRENELPKKPPRRSLDGYKHVMDVEYCPPVSCDGPKFHTGAAKAKEAAQKAPSRENTAEYHEIMEEEMIRGLQQLGWMKVDVKNEWLHNAGVGVVAHVTDSLKQQESPPYIAASL